MHFGVNTYHKAQRIPRGLRVALKPSLCKNSKRFTERWYAILNKCSLDLILLIIEELSNILTELSKEIQETKQAMTQSMSTDELNKTLEDINNQLKQHQQEINDRKIRKYRRDTYDYKME